MKLTGEQYHGFLKSEMRVRTSKPGEIHQLLLDLGINCYITTNFDRLLERAIRANGRRGRLKVVTNTDVQQCVDLCTIKSRNFVFKPHGDIMDGDSIIFTNSDYRDMYENGGRYYAHRTLDTLLATRNVIFVGFGLTDPDFLRIMDRFRNDYKQGVAEKYAIMPDVPAEEMNYWKAAYGIQILSYDTIPAVNGRDYSAIFKVLRELAPAGKKNSLTDKDGRETPDVITQRQRKGLALYAQSVMARFKTNEESIFPLELCPDSCMGLVQSISTEEMLKREVRGFALTVRRRLRISSRTRCRYISGWKLVRFCISWIPIMRWNHGIWRTAAAAPTWSAISFLRKQWLRPVQEQEGVRPGPTGWWRLRNPM